LQAKDSDKLRQILAEHFLITAVYRAVSNIVSGSPELSGQQTYFDLQSNPGKVRMRDYVLVSAALGLQTLPVAKREIPVNVDDFDQTLAYAETRYDDHAFRSLFFTDKGGLYPEQMYSDAGRLAISYLVEPGDDDDFRLALATNPALFNDLSQIGNVNSKEFHDRCVAAGVPDSMVPVVGTDYLDVAWFTQSMVTAGQKLQEIDLFLEANPGIDPENNDFKKLKQQLADSLGQVADQATTSFGGPWGFTTMALLGKASSTKWMLINKFIINSLSAGHPTTAPLAEAVAVAMA